VHEHARAGGATAAGEARGATLAAALAAAGAAALDAVTCRPGDRTVALDLLAADALITLALLAQAEHDPAGLGDFAAGLLRRYGQPS
jgi:hypothetical protein